MNTNIEKLRFTVYLQCFMKVFAKGGGGTNQRGGGQVDIPGVNLLLGLAMLAGLALCCLAICVCKSKVSERCRARPRRTGSVVNWRQGRTEPLLAHSILAVPEGAQEQGRLDEQGHPEAIVAEPIVPEPEAARGTAPG